MDTIERDAKPTDSQSNSSINLFDPLPAFATASKEDQTNEDIAGKQLSLFNHYIISLINNHKFDEGLACDSFSSKFQASTALGLKDHVGHWQMHKDIANQYPNYRIALMNERCEVDLDRGTAALVCDFESKGRPEGVVYSLIIVNEFSRSGQGKVGRWLCTKCTVIAGNGGVHGVI